MLLSIYLSIFFLENRIIRVIPHLALERIYSFQRYHELLLLLLFLSLLCLLFSVFQLHIYYYHHPNIGRSHILNAIICGNLVWDPIRIRRWLILIVILIIYILSTSLSQKGLKSESLAIAYTNIERIIPHHHHHDDHDHDHNHDHNCNHNHNNNENTTTPTTRMKKKNVLRRGLFSVQPIQRNQVIATIPSQLIISKHTILVRE